MDVNISGSGGYIGALAGYNWRAPVTRCYSTGAVSGSGTVGGLVGGNGWDCSVTQCYSTVAVSGGSVVGGLVGRSSGSVTQCYSAGTVSGTYSGSWGLGGLVGSNWGGTVNGCYSTGMVSGASYVGGLVGTGSLNRVTGSFWDIQTSGQAKSDGGTGKTTAEMQTASTFLEVGWDFMDETANGTEDIWWILEGKDYPRLWWETAGR